jgi:hypothetical protein
LSISSIQKRLEKITRKQKIFIAMIIIAGIFLFYGIGIATNFFAQPIFSAFFIISNETAHNLVAYIAVGAAFALGGLALALNFGKLKVSLFGRKTKPTILSIPEPVKTVPTIYPPRTQPKPQPKPQVTVSEKRVIPNPSIAMQLGEKPKTETASVPANQVKKPNATQTTNKGKFTCQSCKKEFSTPMLMLDYANSKTKMLSYCPYCNAPLDTQQKYAVDEELWDKYVNDTKTK